VNVPRAKTPTRTAFFFKEIWDRRKIGIGIRMIIMSDEMLKTVFVIR
jgi:hypothetical protein